VCGDLASLRLHTPDTGEATVLYCESHLPFHLAIGGERAGLEARYKAGEHDTALLYDLGVARLRAGDAEGAASVLEAAREGCPPVPVLERLADAHEALGAIDRALELQREALAAAPREGERHARLARLLAVSGALDQALTAYEAGASADPFAFACVQRAAILRLAYGQAPQAIALLEGFLAGLAPRRKQVIRVRPQAPALTATDHPSRLALEERTRPVRGRRSYEVDAARYGALGLLGDAHESLGASAAADQAYQAGLAALTKIPELFVVEAASYLMTSVEVLRAAWELARLQARGAGDKAPPEETA
jgi:tetratricopeptide (TPR) repeat protein